MEILEDLVKLGVVFVVIGLPCLLIFGQPLFKRWIAFRERQLELEAQMAAEKAARYAIQTERLEQRVRVLERIVTDRGLAVSEEIERLRDDTVN